jgi:hypothetical protein
VGETKKSKEALPSAGNDTCAKIAVAITQKVTNRVTLKNKNKKR